MIDYRQGIYPLRTMVATKITPKGWQKTLSSRRDLWWNQHLQGMNPLPVFLPPLRGSLTPMSRSDGGV